MPQQLARDEAGNIWEVDASGNPVRLHQPAQGAGPQPVRLGTPNATKEAKDQVDLQAARVRLAIDQQKLDAGGGDVAPPPGDLTKTGDAYIATLPKAMQPTVRSMIDGRMAPPSSFAQSKPYWQQMMSAANQADSSFDQGQWSARVALRKQYESQGNASIARTIGSLNTLAAHANSMWENHLHMAGPNVGPLSGVAAGIAQGFDQKYTPAYNTEIGFVQGELQKLIKNGASSEAEAERILGNLRAAQSTEARTAAIKALVEMAEGKIAPIRQGWQAVFGDKPMPTDVTPGSMAVFDNILGNGKKSVPVDRYGTPIAPAPSNDRSAIGGIVPPMGGGGTPPGTPPGPPSGPAPRGIPTKTDNLGIPLANIGGPQDIQFGSDPTPEGPPIGYRYTPGQEAQIADALRKGDVGEAAHLSRQFSGNEPDQSTMAALRAAADTLHADPRAQIRFDYSPTDNILRQTWEKDQFGDNLQKALKSQKDQRLEAGLRGAGNGLLPFHLGEKFNAGVDTLYNGKTYRENMQQQRALTAADEQLHPYATFAGNTIGVGAQALLTQGALGATVGRVAGAPGTTLGRVANAIGTVGRAPITADVATGLLQSTNGGIDPLTSTAFAVGGGALGRGLAQGGGALGRRVGMFGGSAPEAPSSAERTLIGTAQKQGVSDIQQQLDEAARLGVPMSLADTGQGLNSLTGAAVRRAPNVAEQALASFGRRGRDQINRFVGAVNRDLGPTTNVPQLSADLEQQAKTAAGPLYDAAYAAPGASVFDAGGLGGRDSIKNAWTGAANIAREEGRDPLTLGIMFDDAGNPTKFSNPTWQTWDYMKRGLDDGLEKYRDKTTGKLVLDEQGRAMLATRNAFVDAVDKANPDYAAARQAYGGPMQSRDALQFGAESVNMNPQELGVNLAGKSPEQMAQIQLGNRSGLITQADRLRYSSNPWGQIDSPVAEQRLGVVHADKPEGVTNLLTQRDLELKLARSANDIVGNSKTAQRGIADQTFGEDLPQLVLDTGLNLATGQVPIGVVAKVGSRQALKDAMKLGSAFRSERKAEALGPLLLNNDPGDALAALTRLLDRAQARKNYIDAYNRSVARPIGMFGSGLGVAAAPFVTGQ